MEPSTGKLTPIAQFQGMRTSPTLALDNGELFVVAGSTTDDPFCLIRLDANSGESAKVLCDSDGSLGLNLVYRGTQMFAVDVDGNILLMTNQGIIKVNRTSGVVTPFLADGSDPVVVDPNTGWVFFSNFNGVQRYDPRTGETLLVGPQLFESYWWGSDVCSPSFVTLLPSGEWALTAGCRAGQEVVSLTLQPRSRHNIAGPMPFIGTLAGIAVVPAPEPAGGQLIALLALAGIARHQRQQIR
jgi:hypothetical protein